MKIDIIGSVASGKTTLAKKISLKYKVPYYEKDNIVRERTVNGDKKRTSEEYNSKPTLKFLFYNIKWVFEFNGMKKTLFDELRNYGAKCKIFIHSNDALAFIENTYGRCTKEFF